MFLFETDGRKINARNAVDVKIDGLLQHGFLLGREEKPGDDSTPPRLIVDFGCTSQRSVLVESGTVSAGYMDRYCHSDVGTVVQVLLREGPDRPWRWYPGKLLLRRFKRLKHVALVEVMVGGQCRRELIPNRQIWDRAATLSTTHKPVMGIPSKSTANKVSTNVTGCPQRKVAKRKPAKAIDEPKRKRPLRVDQCRLALPFEVLKEIFHSLDTVDRLRCRRTCQLWETLLTSAELCQVMRVSRRGESSSLPVVWDCNYAMYGCILKHITAATRIICIRDTQRFCAASPSDADEVVDLIKEVLDDAGLRIDSVIVHQRSIRLSLSTYARWKMGVFSMEMAAQKARLGSCCGRLIFKNYGVTMESEYGTGCVHFRIPAAISNAGLVDEAQTVELFERHLVSEGLPLDVERISICMSDLIGIKENAKEVIKILHDYQSCDPRPSAHYRGRQWRMDDVADVELAKLNRFSLYALSRFLEYPSEASEEDTSQSGVSNSESSSDYDTQE
ncbi:uncharacterized protein LOC129601573 [Paramacrobiotus metropolitanus]|uniref:uncharacterized protein LOC129601573 n=1 Tax=Paramacrobiotus metropolitanus TaxID=2943436 RepID=UPI00244615F6|nr:uncharacterized protein LOC129601573 [Paramacrobiotus metropolitanus]XP_055356492.1 uncharacterized protein LOC129601573 [Paramacrobiotus metropolitanus]